MYRPPAIALLLTLLASAPATVCPAGIYKWVDANGKTHFGDRPPADVARANEVNIKDIPKADQQAPSDAERRAKQDLMLRNFAQERKEKTAAAAKKKDEKKQLARKCVLAKHNLEQYRNAGYLYGVDDAGNMVIRSDAQRKQAISTLEKTINDHCK